MKKALLVLAVIFWVWGDLPLSPSNYREWNQLAPVSPAARSKKRPPSSSKKPAVTESTETNFLKLQRVFNKSRRQLSRSLSNPDATEWDFTLVFETPVVIEIEGEPMQVPSIKKTIHSFTLRSFWCPPVRQWIFECRTPHKRPFYFRLSWKLVEEKKRKGKEKEEESVQVWEPVWADVLRAKVSGGADLVEELIDQLSDIYGLFSETRYYNASKYLLGEPLRYPRNVGNAKKGDLLMLHYRLHEVLQERSPLELAVLKPRAVRLLANQEIRLRFDLFLEYWSGSGEKNFFKNLKKERQELNGDETKLLYEALTLTLKFYETLDAFLIFEERPNEEWPSYFEQVKMGFEAIMKGKHPTEDVEAMIETLKRVRLELAAPKKAKAEKKKEPPRFVLDVPAYEPGEPPVAIMTHRVRAASKTKKAAARAGLRKWKAPTAIESSL